MNKFITRLMVLLLLIAAAIIAKKKLDTQTYYRTERYANNSYWNWHKKV